MMTDSELEGKRKEGGDGKEVVSRSKGFGFVCNVLNKEIRGTDE